jgi:hypothetical protein
MIRGNPSVLNDYSLRVRCGPSSTCYVCPGSRNGACPDVKTRQGNHFQIESPVKPDNLAYMDGLYKSELEVWIIPKF